jgi:predicted glycoside hydrolase/deacetylase ChbG (UPF0249 family)
MTDAMADAAPLQPIWLCADDYGISKSVSRAIRDLIARGRLNATSVMVVAQAFDRAEAASLSMLNAGGRRTAIGLHVTLTGAFRPIDAGFRPLRGGTFLSLAELMVRGRLHLLSGERLRAEIAAQLAAFGAAFGRKPDFIDGHQHAHLFPQVREALLEVAKAEAPEAWVRQCGGAARRAPADFKTAMLERLSRTFRVLAAARGVRTNPAFAGAYDFGAAAPGDFDRLFPGFLHGLPAQSVVMCHPGLVDDELKRLDPLTTQREREFAYLAGDGLPAALSAAGLTLV